MPPAVIAVVAAVATALLPVIVGSATIAIAGVVISSAVIVAVLTVAIAIAASVAMAIGRKPINSRTNQGDELRLKLDPGMPRQLPLGRCATGGSVVWAFTHGSTDNVPQNAFLVRIIAISDLPIEALVGVYEGKNLLTFAGDITTGLFACNQHMTDGGNVRMWMQVHKGSPNATANSNLTSWNGQWTSSHKGTNMAYAICRYQYDEEGNAFPNGEPSLIFVVDGVKCYDQRYDSTRGAGRTGTQRLATPSTWAYSRNCAVITQQVLRGFHSNGVLLLGAQAEDRDLDDAMLVSAYNTCDEPVSHSGGTQARYRAGYMASCSTPVADILVQLQAAMDGRIIDRGGQITIRPGATHTPVFNLTDDDIIWDQEKSWQPRMNMSELYNFVNGVFVDEATIFNEKPFPPLSSSAYELEDGGQRFELQIAYSAATDWAQVQRMVKRIHLCSRLQTTVAFYLPLWALEMEQDDWFTLTSTRWGFTNKYFQAVNFDLIMSPTLMMAVVGREMASTIDGWNPAVDEKPRGDTTWTGPSGPSSNPTPVLTPTPIVRTSTTNVVEAYGVSIVVSGLGTTAGVAEKLELQLVPTANTATPATVGTYKAINQTIEYWGLVAGISYSVRARTYRLSKLGAWSQWYTFTAGASTLGYSVVVATLVTLTANSDGSLNPTTQLPKTIIPDVVKNGVSVKTAAETSYAITTVGCTASVNNTAGSSAKGNITVTAISGWTATIDLVVTVNSIILPGIRITLQKNISSTSGGGESLGGPGSKTATDSSLASITTSTYMDLTNIMIVTIASGESLYGTGTVSYGFAVQGSDKSNSLDLKWRYSPTGANTWTDFPGSPVYGSEAYSGSDYSEGYDGDAVMTQTKGGLAAGTYDVVVQAKKTVNITGNLHCAGSLTITAKV